MKCSYSRAALGMLALSASVLLTACGSGNNFSPATAGTPPTSPGVNLVAGTDVPLAATLDAAAAFDFVSSVVAKGEANSETPLVLGDAELAVSDTADAMPLAA